MIATQYADDDHLDNAENTLVQALANLQKSAELDPDNVEVKVLLEKLETVEIRLKNKPSASDNMVGATEEKEYKQAINECAIAEISLQKANATLASYTQAFNKNVYEPNPLYTSNKCTTLVDYLGGTDCSPQLQEIIRSALSIQAEKLEAYSKWADFYQKQAESERQSNNAAKHQELTAQYWEARHNIDYYSTKAFIDPIVKKQLLEAAKRKAAHCLRSWDVATYGYLTPAKCDRIRKSMSIAAVEQIVGKGRLVESKIERRLDGSSGAKLEKHAWVSKDGRGRMVCLFADGRLREMTATWNS